MVAVNGTKERALLGALLLRASEVAKLLGISKSLAYRWMMDGTLPVVRVGRVVRVRSDALETFVAENTRGAA